MIAQETLFLYSGISIASSMEGLMTFIASLLSSLRNALLVGVTLLLLLMLYQGFAFDYTWMAFFMRWLHVLSGIMWIGLLWYFNFVQIPNMGRIKNDQKPAITQVIAPAALFWFRWAAAATVLTGLLLAHLNGYLLSALTLEIGSEFVVARYVNIGIGMWLGIIMFLNVWLVIWPNQKKALGLVKASDGEKKQAATLAMVASRTNTALSIPMLYAMVAAQNIF